MSERLAPGWYWVQDMTCPARPVYWDGKVYRTHETSNDVLSWHWATHRVVSHVSRPTSDDLLKMKLINEQSNNTTE